MEVQLEAQKGTWSDLYIYAKAELSSKEGNAKRSPSKR